MCRWWRWANKPFSNTWKNIAEGNTVFVVSVLYPHRPACSRMCNYRRHKNSYKVANTFLAFFQKRIVFSAGQSRRWKIRVNENVHINDSGREFGATSLLVKNRNVHFVNVKELQKLLKRRQIKCNEAWSTVLQTRRAFHQLLNLPTRKTVFWRVMKSGPLTKPFQTWNVYNIDFPKFDQLIFSEAMKAKEEERQNYNQQWQ